MRNYLMGSPRLLDHLGGIVALDEIDTDLLKIMLRQGGKVDVVEDLIYLANGAPADKDLFIFILRIRGIVDFLIFGVVFRCGVREGIGDPASESGIVDGRRHYGFACGLQLF